jgi:hypothetical protein
MVDSITDASGGRRLDSRFEAYSNEAARLTTKLRNPNVPDGKKDRCKARLEDLRARLIPRVVREIQGV